MSKQIIPSLAGLADYGPDAAQAIVTALILRLKPDAADHQSEPIIISKAEIDRIQQENMHCVLHIEDAGEADEVRLSVVRFDDTLSP